ncbi:MAG: AAA family ATPase [Planctomycetes bacterium]|nr:AAA family ATPase [Planctomycetota bacterium]
MNEELQKLLEQARIVQNQPDSFHRLADMLRLQSKDDTGILVEFAQSADDLQRRAAISAAAGRTEPEVIAAMAALANDPLPFVRQSLAFALTDYSTWPMNEAVEALLSDSDANVRQAAIWAAKPRAAVTASLVKRLEVEESNWIRTDIANALADCDHRLALPALFNRLGKDADPGVQQASAGAIERQLGNLRAYPADLDRPPTKTLNEIRRRVSAYTYGSYPILQAFLSEQLAAHVDVEQLAGFGTVLTAEAEKGQLPRGYCLDEAVESVLTMLDGGPPRAVVLVGESGAGKTALVHEITHRLLRDPRRPGYVLRMAPQDFLAGTKYIGEWETKVRNVINAVKPPRRVILYIPAIEELAWMGTWEKSEASVATALAPYIERGDLTILGESTVEGFRKGLGANRSLRRLFHTVELQPPDADEVRAIIRSVVDEADAEISDSVLDRLSELADYFVSGIVQPTRKRSIAMQSGISSRAASWVSPKRSMPWSIS